MSDIGSIWRRWDLHLHTSSSYDYKYNGQDSDQKLADSLISKSISAVAITDHFVIDKKRITNLRNLAKGIVFFPGVELRTDKGSDNIHIILIFDCDINLDALEEDFNAFRRNCAKNSTDNQKIYWDFNDILSFAHKHDAIISIHAGRKENGVDREITNALKVGEAIKEEIARNIDIFEMGTTRELQEYRERVFPNIGFERPMIICSDNHDGRNYNPTYKLWLKCDLTFNGLKQIMYEPSERVFIGDSLPDEKKPYRVIKYIRFEDDDMPTEPVYFNRNLNCIIGGKSTGKSTLLRNMAFVLDQKQLAEKEGNNALKTKTVKKASVYWEDDVIDNERKIVYIPQSYLNRLSDDYSRATEIDNLIKEIVLQKEDYKKSFDELTLNTETLSKNNVKEIVNMTSNLKKYLETLKKKKENGDIKDIDKAILETKETINNLSSEELSEDILEKYSSCQNDIAVACKKIEAINGIVSNLTTLGVEITIEPKFYYLENEVTLPLIETINKVGNAARTNWNEEQKLLIERYRTQITSIEESIKQQKEFVASYASAVENNQEASKQTEKLQALNKKREEALVIEQNLQVIRKSIIECRDRLVQNQLMFNSYHERFASLIREQVGDDLVFYVESRFNKQDFLKKAQSIFNNTTSEYKNLFSDPDFEIKKDTLDAIVVNTLNGKLALKSDNSRESALRELFVNWNTLKFIAEMSGDSIEIMSPGNKALVLLKVLIELADSECPILIDQPEDDLDNKSIFEELTGFIKTKKKDRQIIIVTHNANIVVGADAEEVIVANQHSSRTPNRSTRFEYISGAIENNVASNCGGFLGETGIQQHICQILEGGEIAFEKRKNKYRIK